MQWARDFCKWLDDWTYYRDLPEIHKAFRKHLSTPVHLEAEWMITRRPFAQKFPAFFRTLAARKLAHLVLVAQKPLNG